MKTTIPYVSYYDGTLNKDICQSIIDRFESEKTNQKRTTMEDVFNYTELNVSETEGWKDVEEMIVKLADKYSAIFMSDHSVSPILLPSAFEYEQVRIKKYSPELDDKFNIHSDANDVMSCRRFLIMLWYLNDVESGGETEIHDFRMKPKAGSLLVFPPFWTHGHSGLAPISGPKYIIGTYLQFA